MTTETPKICPFITDAEGSKCTRPYNHGGSCDSSIKCKHCPYRAPGAGIMKSHMLLKHRAWATTADPGTPSIPTSTLKEVMDEYAVSDIPIATTDFADTPKVPKVPKVYACKHCDFTNAFPSKVGSHTLKEHPETRGGRPKLKRGYQEPTPVPDDVSAVLTGVSIPEPDLAVVEKWGDAIWDSAATEEDTSADRHITFAEFDSERDWVIVQIADLQKWLPDRQELAKRYVDALVKFVEKAVEAGETGIVTSTYLDRIERILFPESHR